MTIMKLLFSNGQQTSLLIKSNKHKNNRFQIRQTSNRIFNNRNNKLNLYKHSLIEINLMMLIAQVTQAIEVNLSLKQMITVSFIIQKTIMLNLKFKNKNLLTETQQFV